MKICPDLVNTTVTHQRKTDDPASYDEYTTNQFGECVKEHCPCYALLGKNEYCSKHSREFKD